VALPFASVAPPSLILSHRGGAAETKRAPSGRHGGVWTTGNWYRVAGRRISAASDAVFLSASTHHQPRGREQAAGVPSGAILGAMQAKITSQEMFHRDERRAA
jgi:hypothetical protein